MQSRSISLESKLKELSVNEFLGILEDWHDRKKEEARQSEEEWVKGVRELSKFLGCSMATAYRYIHQGIFPDAVQMIGGTYYFNKKLINEYNQSKRGHYAAR